MFSFLKKIFHNQIDKRRKSNLQYRVGNESHTHTLNKFCHSAYMRWFDKYTLSLLCLLLSTKFKRFFVISANFFLLLSNQIIGFSFFSFFLLCFKWVLVNKGYLFSNDKLCYFKKETTIQNMTILSIFFPFSVSVNETFSIKKLKSN